MTSAPTLPAVHAAAPSTAPARQELTVTSVRKFSAVQSRLPWDGHFSAKNFKTAPGDRLELYEIRKDLRTAILSLPQEHTQFLGELEVRNQSHQSRGLGNGHKIILHTGTIDDEDELISVFVHEVGHVVDLGMIKGENGKHTRFYDGPVPIYSDDSSVQFYRLSWVTAKQRKRVANRDDFVSGYAMHNCFEDFAESYTFYRLHGEKFRSAAEKSNILQAKYDFLKREVFDGVEFQLDKSGDGYVHGILFDTTLLKIDTPHRFEVLARN